jgi:hypothetical protein
VLNKSAKVEILKSIYRSPGSETKGEYYKINREIRAFVGPNSLVFSAILDWSKANDNYYSSVGDKYEYSMGGVDYLLGVDAGDINTGKIRVAHELRLFSLFGNDWLNNSSSVNNVFYIDFLRFLDLFDISEPVTFSPSYGKPADRYPDPPPYRPAPGPGGPSLVPPGTNPPGPGGPSLVPPGVNPPRSGPGPGGPSLLPPGTGTTPPGTIRPPVDRIPNPPGTTPGPGGPSLVPPRNPNWYNPPSGPPVPNTPAPTKPGPPNQGFQGAPWWNGPGQGSTTNPPPPPITLVPPPPPTPPATPPPGPGANPSPGPGSGTPSNAYIRYIQYTLKSDGISVSDTGSYDAATKRAVGQFQKKKNIDFDEKVDSQTKAALAVVWLDLLKNNKARYDSLYSAAPDPVKVYIRNATKYSDIANVCNPASGDEYRRISYTGLEGPTRIEDHIVIEVPRLKDNKGAFFPWQEIVSVDIRSGSWPVRVGQIYFYEQDLAARSHIVPEFNGSSIKATQQNKDTVGQVIQPNSVLQYAAKNRRKIKYIMIQVIGTKLNDGVHGPFAEGFSISDVSFTMKTPGTPSEARDPSYVKIGDVKTTATATLTMYGQTQIRSGDIGAFNLGTLTAALANSGQSKVSDINLKTISLSVTPIEDGKPIIDADGNVVKRDFTKVFDKGVFTLNEKNLLSQKFEWDQDECTVDVEPLTTSTAINGANPIIISVKRTRGTQSSDLTPTEIAQQFSISNRAAPKYIVQTTNGVEVISREFSEIFALGKDFYLADPDVAGLPRQNKKRSVNAKDGVVVLTDDAGNPTGLPDYSKFNQPNVETSFGTTLIAWNSKFTTMSVPVDVDEKTKLAIDPPTPVAPDYGLQWGFYNIRSRQFLGTKLSYQYIMANKPDIYIGVHAFDADRNVATMENIVGVDNRVDTLSEFQFPAKTICPIYSVRVSPRAKIAISAPPKDLSKFDTWFVNLSRGRFYKKIEVPQGYNFVDWKKNYKGVTLRCFYDTTQIPIPSSSVFGTGYYDIWEENPIIISDKEIQLKHGSFVVTQEQVDKEGVNTFYTDASEFIPWFEIEVKNSNGTWSKVNQELISNYNKHTGTISFDKEIIPSDNSNVRVSYTIKNPNVMMYHIDGNEIPLNPYVSYSGIMHQSSGSIATVDSYKVAPMHFYILPSSIEELVNGDYKEISEYTKPSSIVNWSYNYNIFNSNSIDYNPFAMHLGSAVINSSFTPDNVQLLDLRVKGGGISQSAVMAKEIEANSNIMSFNDIKAGRGMTYPSGGYVIVRIPKEVRNNFTNIDQVYQIVRSNLTAGVAFDIQDLDGTDWKNL